MMKAKEDYLKLIREFNNNTKVAFKNLVAKILAKYAIILPRIFIGLIIFAFILYIFMAWLN